MEAVKCLESNAWGYRSMNYLSLPYRTVSYSRPLICEITRFDGFHDP